MRPATQYNVFGRDRQLRHNVIRRGFVIFTGDRPREGLMSRGSSTSVKRTGKHRSPHDLDGVSTLMSPRGTAPLINKSILQHYSTSRTFSSRESRFNVINGPIDRRCLGLTSPMYLPSRRLSQRNDVGAIFKLLRILASRQMMTSRWSKIWSYFRWVQYGTRRSPRVSSFALFGALVHEEDDETGSQGQRKRTKIVRAVMHPAECANVNGIVAIGGKTSGKCLALELHYVGT
jgi:hypothetical protein